MALIQHYQLALSNGLNGVKNPTQFLLSFGACVIFIARLNERNMFIPVGFRNVDNLKGFIIPAHGIASFYSSLPPRLKINIFLIDCVSKV